LGTLRGLGGRLAPELVSLNLACNALSTLRGIEGLRRLRRLNLQRNQLTSLEELRGLSSLQFLDASANSIKTLAGVASGPGALAALTELRLHHNALAGAGELASLARLSRVVKLSLYNNPVTRRLGLDHSRAATLAALAPHGCLRFLDARRVGPTELAEAARGGASWADIAAAEAAQQQQQQQQQHKGASDAPEQATLSSVGASAIASLQSSSQLAGAPASLSAAVALLPQLTVPLSKPSTLNAAAAAAAALRREPPVICFSSRHSNGMPAATLRQNRTGSFSWPSGGLAASADLDPAGGYRLLAMFNRVGPAAVALSADAGGGFASYATGRPALAWKRGGGGSHTSPSGAMLATWTRRRGLHAPVSVDLGQGLGLVYNASNNSCTLRLEAAAFDPAIDRVEFSQEAGALVVLAGGRGEGGAASGTDVPHTPLVPPGLPRASAQAMPHPPAAAVQLDPPQPVQQSRAAVAAALSAAAANHDLAAVLARAHGLLARTAAEQQAEAEAQAAQRQPTAGIEQ
jgi:hypothetical protein